MFSLLSSTSNNNNKRYDPLPKNLNFTGLIPLQQQNICYCDSTTSSNNEKLDDTIPNDPIKLLEKKKLVQAELDRLGGDKIDYDKSCSSCYWVGIGTCTGLAGYFAYMAFEPLTQHEIITGSFRRKPIYLVISAGFIGLGCYRIYEG